MSDPTSLDRFEQSITRDIVARWQERLVKGVSDRDLDALAGLLDKLPQMLELSFSQVLNETVPRLCEMLAHAPELIQKKVGEHLHIVNTAKLPVHVARVVTLASALIVAQGTEKASEELVRTFGELAGMLLPLAELGQSELTKLMHSFIITKASSPDQIMAAGAFFEGLWKFASKSKTITHRLIWNDFIELAHESKSEILLAYIKAIAPLPLSSKVCIESWSVVGNRWQDLCRRSQMSADCGFGESPRGRHFSPSADRQQAIRLQVSSAGKTISAPNKVEPERKDISKVTSNTSSAEVRFSRHEEMSAVERNLDGEKTGEGKRLRFLLRIRTKNKDAETPLSSAVGGATSPNQTSRRRGESEIENSEPQLPSRLQSLFMGVKGFMKGALVKLRPGNANGRQSAVQRRNSASSVELSNPSESDACLSDENSSSVHVSDAKDSSSAVSAGERNAQPTKSRSNEQVSPNFLEARKDVTKERIESCLRSEQVEIPMPLFGTSYESHQGFSKAHSTTAERSIVAVPEMKDRHDCGGMVQGLVEKWTAIESSACSGRYRD